MRGRASRLLVRIGRGASTVLSAGLLVLATAGPAQAQTAKLYPRITPPPPSGATFGSVLALNQTGGSLKPMLRGGRVADSATWPASFYLRYEAQGEPYACTAALVGPRALLTAAHCVPDDGSIRLAFGSGPPQDGQCERHGAWRNGDDSADFALCRLDSPIVGPPTFRYETIDVQPVAGWVAASRKILLSGYGCTSDDVVESSEELDRQAAREHRADAAGKPGPVPLFRIGFNRLAESSASPPRFEREQFYHPIEYFNLITMPGGANVCPGDSGGPAFVLNESSATSFAERALVAVNSRVLFTDPDTQERYGASLLSAVGAPTPAGDTLRVGFEAWARDWAVRMGVRICGIGLSPGKCRLT